MHRVLVKRVIRLQDAMHRFLPRPSPSPGRGYTIGLTVRSKHGTIAPRHGGVGTPVGLTVFKTAEGSLGAVPGGFDSHTPLPLPNDANKLHQDEEI